MIKLWKKAQKNFWIKKIAAHDQKYLSNLSREPKSLATPDIEFVTTEFDCKKIF